MSEDLIPYKLMEAALNAALTATETADRSGRHEELDGVLQTWIFCLSQAKQLNLDNQLRRRIETGNAATSRSD